MKHFFVTATLNSDFLRQMKAPPEAHCVGHYDEAWCAYALAGVLTANPDVRTIQVVEYEDDAPRGMPKHWENPTIPADYWKTREGEWEATEAHEGCAFRAVETPRAVWHWAADVIRVRNHEWLVKSLVAFGVPVIIPASVADIAEGPAPLGPPKEFPSACTSPAESPSASNVSTPT